MQSRDLVLFSGAPDPISPNVEDISEFFGYFSELLMSLLVLNVVCLFVLFFVKMIWRRRTKIRMIRRRRIKRRRRIRKRKKHIVTPKETGKKRSMQPSKLTRTSYAAAH